MKPATRRWPAARPSAALALMIVACGTPAAPSPPATGLAPTEPGQADAVLFLVGDAGEERAEDSPLLRRLREDIEAWSAGLATDSTVLVAFLGDNVYPEGLRDRSDRGFPEDSARLHGQVWTVDGPEAARRGARALFVPGNHDWGNMPGQRGLDRLANMERALLGYGAAGSAVRLAPAGGAAGPFVTELGTSAHILAIDTESRLQDDDAGTDAPWSTALAAALTPPDSRPVVVLAHHPYSSDGEHGGGAYPVFHPFWLLHRAGVLVQDATSEPYREFLTSLTEAFAAGGAPLIYAAGHDHGLQVRRGTARGGPTWSLVSGAGSKVAPIGDSEDLLWAAERQGYMRLVFLGGGGVELQVEASSLRRPVSCEPRLPDADTCMVHAMENFDTRYVVRLR